jgi:REP element-mobilizing transposase RayT
MSRGNARGLLFLDERDFERFIEVLKATFSRFGIVCYAFCLMPNHYHLVLMTPGANLSAAIKHLNSVYAQWWNYRHQRCGHVFQGRFKAQIVQQDRYLLVVCRYVVLNPVRAGLAAHPREWRWSSYRASAHTEPAPEFLDTCAVDRLFALPAEGASGVAYQRFVDDLRLDDSEIGRLIRDDERFVGDESFLCDARASLAHHASRELPRREYVRPAPSLSRLFGVAGSTNDRNDRIWRARVEYGYRLIDIARHVDLHPVTVGDIIRGYRGRQVAGEGQTPKLERQENGAGGPAQVEVPPGTGLQNLG